MKWLLDTPLIIEATSENKYDFVKVLLKYNVNMNVVDDEGFTPLHLAVYFEHTEIEKLLRQNGANPNIKNKYGITPDDYARMVINEKKNGNPPTK